MFKEIYHTNKEFTSTVNLPLSWTNNGGNDELSTIKISRDTIWLNGGSFTKIENFASSINNFSKKKKIIIRGCNVDISNKLKESGFKETLFAKEAIIELSKEMQFSKKFNRRINSLLKRGKVKEIFHSKENTELLEKFKHSTVHWKKPSLKNLFLDSLNSKTRLFIYEIAPKKWEGAILVSKNSQLKIQGEQFFRKIDGLNGVMDAILFQIKQTFKEEGYTEFSLGEVPFILDNSSQKFSKTNMLLFIGKRIKYAYNYEGLHYFKNKYATRWDDLYICSKGKLRLWDLFGMAKESNLISLLLYKTFS